jgi:SAM-dependent methyltransferase
VDGQHQGKIKFAAQEHWMQAAEIQKQYDHVIASQYDRDPQNTTGMTLDRAIDHLRAEGVLESLLPPMRVLDVGMGTGMFLQKLRNISPRQMEPAGLDISSQMAAIAKQKLPDLNVAIDDGANLHRHFDGEQFDLIATHFVTGFVEIHKLADNILQKLVPGGYWSFVGGTTRGYPELQRRSQHPLLRFLYGGHGPSLEGMICPQDQEQIASVLRQAGFLITQIETFRPELKFPDFDAFIEYGYHGGWLTPFIEEIGLHRARKWQRALLNRIVFPVTDHHSIVLAVARRPL